MAGTYNLVPRHGDRLAGTLLPGAHARCAAAQRAETLLQVEAADAAYRVARVAKPTVRRKIGCGSG